MQVHGRRVLATELTVRGGCMQLNERRVCVPACDRVSGAR